jgi:hypothetical protein
MSKRGLLASILHRSGAHQGLIYTILGRLLLISMPILHLSTYKYTSKFDFFLTFPKAFLQPSEQFPKSGIKGPRPTLLADVSAFSDGYPLVRPTTPQNAVISRHYIPVVGTPIQLILFSL